MHDRNQFLFFSILMISTVLMLYSCTPALDQNEIYHENIFSVIPASQQGELWCWAAVTETVGRHLGVILSQCEMVNIFVNGKGREDYIECCGDSPHDLHPACNEKGRDPMLDGEVGIRCEKDEGKRWNWKMIVDAIDRYGPIVYVKEEPNAGGHTLVIQGYIEIKGEVGSRRLLVADSSPLYLGNLRLETYAHYYNDQYYKYSRYYFNCKPTDTDNANRKIRFYNETFDNLTYSRMKSRYNKIDSPFHKHELYCTDSRLRN